jgi:hypothetical protein
MKAFEDLEDLDDLQEGYKKCPKCKGDGKFKNGLECIPCNGTGAVDEDMYMSHVSYQLERFAKAKDAAGEVKAAGPKISKQSLTEIYQEAKGIRTLLTRKVLAPLENVLGLPASTIINQKSNQPKKRKSLVP